MKKKMDIQQTTINNQKTEIAMLSNKTQNQVDSLSKIISTKVMFSAGLSYSGADYSLQFGQNLVFNKIITNEGNAYNPSTGAFTAPYNGYYYMSANILGRSAHDACSYMRQNGHNILNIYTDEVNQGSTEQGYR